MSQNQNPNPNPSNLRIAPDDTPGEDVGRPEYVTLAEKLTQDQVEQVAILSTQLEEVRTFNLAAEDAVELLADHMNTLVTVFEAVVPLIQRVLDNYNEGSTATRAATASAQGIQGVLGSVIGPALINLQTQLPNLVGFLEAVKRDTSPNTEGKSV